jgi:hypothetical protein
LFCDSIGLTYANIQLKNEVQNLSSRINESKIILFIFLFLFHLLFINLVEKKFSNMELNNISLTIERIKTRLHFFEQNSFRVNIFFFI